MWDGTQAAVNLKYMIFYGMYMYDEVLIFIASHFGRQLDQFIMSREHVLTYADASDYAIHSTSTRMRRLERRVSEILDRPWTCCGKLDLGSLHYADGKDDDVLLNL